MSRQKLARSGLSLAVLAVACTGLDPGAFRPKESPSSDPAGFSFDAGPTPDAGGRAASGVTNRAGSGARATGGRSTDSDGGAAGESDDGGRAGVASEAGSGGGGHGGSGGAGGGRAGNGGSGAGRGGASESGGASGLASGGAGNGSAGLAAAGKGGSLATHALYFSEYVEGSSSYKALEITARETSSFASCRLVTYFNGGGSGSGIALDGSLAAGESYVLCSSALATLLDAVCERSTNLTFNGDDALALECDGATLDVIGQIGVDPGDAWGAGEASTLNHTLRRNCAAQAGDANGSDAFEPTNEWSAFPVDTFEGLGSNDCSEATTP